MFPMNVRLCGGLERVEIEEVTRLIQRGYDARLFVSQYIGDGDKRPEWLKVIKALNWKNRLLKWWYPLSFLVRNHGADIFHGHYMPTLNLLAGARAVNHYHGLVVAELPLYRFSWARRNYHSAHYIFCARHLRDTYKIKYPDIPEDHMHVIYNGVDTEIFRPFEGERNPGPLRFSYHGRWAENKGIILLIEAIRILEKNRTDFECHIAGAPDIGITTDADKIGRKVYHLVSDMRTIKLAGPIAYRDLPAFLSGMDFSIVPSTYPDPFPLVPLESMACGLPVIAFDTGGLRESVVDGVTGMLVKDISAQGLASAISLLLDDVERIHRMSLAARSHVMANFTWDRHVNELLGIYQSMTKY